MEYQADRIAESAGLAYDNLIKDSKKLKADVAEQADALSVAATEALTQAQRSIDVRGAVQGAVQQGTTETLRAAGQVVNEVARAIPRLEGGAQNQEPPPPGPLAEYEIGSDPSIPVIQ
jgi:glutamate dehydrogenase/leucine dehydrogenase